MVATILYPTKYIYAFLASTLQFLVAPYSFFASLTALLMLGPAIFFSHYAVYVPLQWFTSSIYANDYLSSDTKELLSLPINSRFIVAFFLIDQLLCVICTFQTPVGPSKQYPRTRLIQSIVYGFLNCKTYFLVLLFALSGENFKIDLLAWLIDMNFGLTPRVVKLMSSLSAHWASLFYNMHRLAHLPIVYEHAHKQHHYLHDCTAFDAHIYGSGQAEEWFTLQLEYFMAARFGCVPASLGFHTLMQSWANKIGHTRKELEGRSEIAAGINHHADHHKTHTKNFGIYNCCLDMLFGTNFPDNDNYEYGNFLVSRTIEGDQIKFAWTCLGNKGSLSLDEMKAYYDPNLVRFLIPLVAGFWFQTLIPMVSRAMVGKAARVVSKRKAMAQEQK